MGWLLRLNSQTHSILYFIVPVRAQPPLIHQIIVSDSRLSENCDRSPFSIHLQTLLANSFQLSHTKNDKIYLSSTDILRMNFIRCAESRGSDRRSQNQPARIRFRTSYPNALQNRDATDATRGLQILSYSNH